MEIIEQTRNFLGVPLNKTHGNHALVNMIIDEIATDNDVEHLKDNYLS